jgi:uncharacterized membrane protein YfcA
VSELLPGGLTSLQQGLSLSTVLLCAGAFLAGGLVKGTLGIGLPLFAVPLLSLALPPTQAMALMIVPVLASNLWQLRDSGVSREGARRFLPLMAVQALTTLITMPLTLALPEATVRTLLAGVVLSGVALLALPLRLQVPPAQERWWSAGVGLLSGLFGGISSLTGPVIVSYLVSLRLPREVFVGTISLIYLSSALPMYGTMLMQGRIGGTEALLSAAALLPVGLGLAVGRRVRGRLGEVWFRRALLGFLALLALLLIAK